MSEISTALRAFKVEHVAKKKVRTQADYERMLDKYFISKLGNKKLSEVTYESITEITDKLADRSSEQSHAMTVVRTFLRWCVHGRLFKD